jgi:hypothetical protein
VGEIDLAIPWGWLSKSVLYINQKDKNPYKSKDEIFFLLNTALRREVERKLGGATRRRGAGGKIEFGSSCSRARPDTSPRGLS